MEAILIILGLALFSNTKCSEEVTTAIFEDSRASSVNNETSDNLNNDSVAAEDNAHSSKFNRTDGIRSVVEDPDSRFSCSNIGRKLTKMTNKIRKANQRTTLDLKIYSTSRKQSQRVMLRIDDKSFLDKIEFDIRRKTVLVTHGFLSDGTTQWIEDMEKALLKWVFLTIHLLLLLLFLIILY